MRPTPGGTRVRCRIDGRAVGLLAAEVRHRPHPVYPFLLRLIGYDSPNPAYGEAQQVGWTEQSENVWLLTITGWRALPEEEEDEL